jgi:hypothetical protein
MIYIFSESVEERRWLVLSAPGPRHIHTKRCIIRSISSLNTADSPCFLWGGGWGQETVWWKKLLAILSFCRRQYPSSKF